MTHPEMTRYFMSIPEAAQLVIQAAALDAKQANGADVFVLDMGDPVRIIELAERFARLHGRTPRIGIPQEDPCGPGEIEIVFTGIRPGEKLHEELAHADEELRRTPAPGVSAHAPAPRQLG